MRHGELCVCPQCRPFLYPDERKPARRVLTLGSRMRTVPLHDPEAARERHERAERLERLADAGGMPGDPDDEPACGSFLPAAGASEYCRTCGVHRSKHTSR